MWLSVAIGFDRGEKSQLDSRTAIVHHLSATFGALRCIGVWRFAIAGTRLFFGLDPAA